MLGRIEFIASQYSKHKIYTFKHVSLEAGHRTHYLADVRYSAEPEFLYVEMGRAPVPVLESLASGDVKGVAQLCFHAVHPQTLWQVLPLDKEHAPRWYLRINGKDHLSRLAGQFSFSGYALTEGLCFPNCLGDRTRHWTPGAYTMTLVVKNTVWQDPSGKRQFYGELATESVSFRILESGDFASKAGHKLPTEAELKSNPAGR